MQVRPSPEPHPGLTGARAVRAVGPRPEAEALRSAYLELLKLGLCDLIGAGTTSVGRMAGGEPAARELSGEGLRLRAAGMDWPLHGLSMVGLRRLDGLQTCVESVVHEGVDGDLIEAGAWRGGASILMRATLDTLGEDAREVFVADSFQGFPAADDDPGEGGQWAAMDYLGVPLDEVRQNFERLGFERGVTFVPGFFQETLPALRGRRWSVVRLDGDTYEATRVALQSLYPGLSRGGWLVVDDYGALDECRRAVDEFRAEQGVAEPLEEVDWTCVRWRRESPAPEPEAVPPALPDANGARAVRRPRELRVPTSHELELTRERDALRERLAETEVELGRLRRSKLGRLKSRIDRVRARLT
jgi:O-methyltransferase